MSKLIRWMITAQESMPSPRRVLAALWHAVVVGQHEVARASQAPGPSSA